MPTSTAKRTARSCSRMRTCRSVFRTNSCRQPKTAASGRLTGSPMPTKPDLNTTPKTFCTKWQKERGTAATLAFSTNQQSIDGTLARTQVRSTHRTHVPSTCSSTIRPATCRASTCGNSRRKTARSTSLGSVERPASSSRLRKSWSITPATQRRRSLRTRTCSDRWGWALRTSAAC